MDLQKNLRKYAKLVIAAGVNLQKDQELLINAPITCAEFTRLVVEEAYKAGAKIVTVQWSDERVSRLKYDYGALSLFEQFPDWQALLQNGIAERGGALLSISAQDPTAFAGVDPRKPAAQVKAAHEACKAFYDGMDQAKIAWCIVAAPSPAWAVKVFPGCPEQEAVEKLWDAIFTAVRVNTPDPIAAWEAHKNSFTAKVSFLDEAQFDALRYENSLGTNLTIGLPKNHRWEGGGSSLINGRYFFPNMPTEEIFSVPDKNRAEGTVYSAMPLNYQGNLIDNFSITFHEGRITDFTAEKGYDVLKQLIETDEGSHRLGEVALIPRKSPLAQMGILFYNTLYDENASCHFAIGRGYAECLEGGLEMSREELNAAGMNDSVTHVDFMVGTDDLKITGIKQDGAEILLFENGNWAF